jgi:hypothetical protein
LVGVSAVGLLALLVVPAAAEEGAPDEATQPEVEAKAEGGIEIHYIVETGVATTYVFRGVPQYLDKTDPSSMTTLNLTFGHLGPGALSLGVWNATAIAKYGDQPGTKLEFDLTATYTVPLGKLFTGAAGYIAYVYPEAEQVDGAHEFWASLSVNDLPITPTLAVYAEVVRLKGAYTLLSLSRTFELGAFTVSPMAGVGLSGYKGVSFGLNDITALVTGRWNHSSGFYAAGTVAYSYNGLLADAAFDDKSTVYGLVVAGFSR